MQAGELQRLNSLLLHDFDSASKILRWTPVCSHLANCTFLLLPNWRVNKYVFKVCQKSIPELCWVSTVYDCSSFRRTKGIGIFKVPLADDDALRSWSDEWLGEIRKSSEMVQGCGGQINDDKIQMCGKHLNPEDIEICMNCSMNSAMIIYTLDTSFTQSFLKQRNGWDNW